MESLSNKQNFQNWTWLGKGEGGGRGGKAEEEHPCHRHLSGRQHAASQGTETAWLSLFHKILNPPWDFFVLQLAFYTSVARYWSTFFAFLEKQVFVFQENQMSSSLKAITHTTVCYQPAPWFLHGKIKHGFKNWLLATKTEMANYREMSAVCFTLFQHNDLLVKHMRGREMDENSF